MYVLFCLGLTFLFFVTTPVEMYVLYRYYGFRY